MELPANTVFTRLRPSRTLVLVAALAVPSAVLAACVGPPPSSSAAQLVAFNEVASVVQNGNIPVPSAVTACGSDTATFLAELATTNPLNAKVPMHWGDIVPGKEMMASGVIQGPSLGNLDLPFDHPWGGDMTFDFSLDKDYAALGGQVGSHAAGADPDLKGKDSGGQPGAMTHVELETGLIPHNPGAPGPATGQDWQDAANADQANPIPGFVPKDGDRALVMGRWIIDCGHSDYHTELHPITFLADARTSGSTTQMYTYYNPYHETQLYNPDSLISSNVADATRLTSSNTLPFPAYLVAEILRLAHIGDPGSASGYPSTFGSFSLEQANTVSPPPWYVCAPQGTSGAHLSVSYDIVARPGVTFTVKPDDTTGCAAVSSVLGPSYTPMNPVQRTCTLPWDWLNQQADAVIGNTSLNIQQTIQSDLPAQLQSNTFLQQAIAQNPVTSCYDPLSVTAPDPVGTAEQVVTTNAGQPYPFYGWITAAWAN